MEDGIKPNFCYISYSNKILLRVQNKFLEILNGSYNYKLSIFLFKCLIVAL